MNTFDKTYWTSRYMEQQTGWDLGQISPPLKNYVDQLTDKELNILIPGAGNAYEAEYLHKRGFKHVHLLDISEIPLSQFKKRVPDFPADHIHLSDFFNHHYQYDLIIEQTFFCALNPELRKKYVLKMAQLLKKGGKLAGLLFNVDFNQPHPPFGGNETEYRLLFEAYFDISKMEPCKNSVKPRLGNELFIELQQKS